MEERTNFSSGRDDQLPVPCDLDDLIFQGECWLASDR